MIVLIRLKIKLLSLFSLKIAGNELFRLFITPIKPIHIYKSKVFCKYEEVSFMLKGKKINGYRCSIAGGKKALILHGFASTLHKFENFVEPLMQNGWEVLAFDAPAHGGSEGKTVHAVDYADMILEVIQRFGPIGLFIGHSFGGLALSLALEKISLPNAKIVLIAPATETTSAIDEAMKVLGIKSNKLKSALEETIFRTSGKPATWYSVKRAVHNIKNPILWIHDELDTITPIDDVWEIKNEHLPNIQFHITKGLGHRHIYKDESVLKMVIHFANNPL